MALIQTTSLCLATFRPSSGWSTSRTQGTQTHPSWPSTHLRLHPGEEIRTPRILLLFWDGDRLHGHSLLRRFILAHHTPRPSGRLLQPPIADSAWGERPAALQIAKVRWLRDNALPVDTFWIDAGWYGDRPYDPKADTFGTAWATQVGEWYPLKAHSRDWKRAWPASTPMAATNGARWTVEHPRQGAMLPTGGLWLQCRSPAAS